MSIYPDTVRTLQVHPANWVDSDLVTIQVEKGNRFQVHGITYWLEDTTPPFESQGYATREEFEKDSFAVVASLTIRGELWGADYALGNIIVFREDVGKPFVCMCMDYIREHNDPVGAAVQMILLTV